MSSYVLSCGICNNVGAKVNRTDKSDSDCIVDDKWESGFMCDLRNRLEIGDIKLWIPDCFRINSPGLFGYCPLESLRILGVNELNRASELWQRMMEKLM